MKAMENLSAVALSVIWNSFLSIAEEMGSTLRRTAFSEAVREGEDFSTGVFDRRGLLVAQGNFTPGHLGAMPFVVKSVMEIFPAATLRPGDAVFLNDSKLGSGHFPDCFLVSPVFDGDDLIGYVVTTAHQVDVGGAAPGSQKVQGVSEAFQEGLRILPIRLVRNNEIDEDLLRMIMANVRLPDLVKGDILAQRNANFIGAQRLIKLFRTYGKRQTELAIDDILDRSEKHTRELIRKIPAGTYSFTDYVEDCGLEGQSVTVAVDVTVGDGQVTVDFSRSSDSVPAAINSYINYTRAYTLFAIKVFSDALLPQNEGMIRPVEVVARDGSFFNPRFPAASGGRAAIQVRIFEVINGALAQAMPDRAVAAFTHWGNPNIGGVDDRTGRQFVMYDLMFGGYGGRSMKDGAEALSPVVNCANIPVEVHETNNPVVIKRLELIPDSGGAGKYRGGCGLRKDVEIRTNSCVLTMLSDRHKHPAFGLFGGMPGSLAQTVIQRGDKAEQITSKSVHTLSRGDVVSYRLNGAGGYGPPAERDRRAIEDDIVDGYVSRAAAAKLYGLR